MNRRLTLAVSDAERQLLELRSRVDSLRGDVRSFAPHAYQRAFESTSTSMNGANHEAITPSQPPIDITVRPASSCPVATSFVQSLTEDRAKALLLVR